MDVHFDDAGVGRDLDHVEAAVGWRMIALDVNGLAGNFRCFLDCCCEGGVVLGVGKRRHEYAHVPVARLDGHRGPNRAENLCGSSRIDGRRKQRDRLPPVAQERVSRRQRGMGRERVDRDHMRSIRSPKIGERSERKPEPDR